MSTATAGTRVHRAGDVVCGPATSREQLAAHYRIRRAVFVDEQGLFEGTDRDEHDTAPEVVHVLATVSSLPVGTVRLFPLDGSGDLWQGDRLAVLRAHRVHGAGAPLVRYAVARAGAAGGRRMLAHIQLPNVVFFERLGWTRSGPIESDLGVEHQPMSIELSGGRTLTGAATGSAWRSASPGSDGEGDPPPVDERVAALGGE
jgi:putative N-acetyltransferase (TIGR04045 family)